MCTGVDLAFIYEIIVDAVVDTIALILKTLHIRDLRSLQSELNDLTVIAQTHTARP